MTETQTLPLSATPIDRLAYRTGYVQIVHPGRSLNARDLHETFDDGYTVVEPAVNWGEYTHIIRDAEYGSPYLARLS